MIEEPILKQCTWNFLETNIKSIWKLVFVGRNFRNSNHQFSEVMAVSFREGIGEIHPIYLIQLHCLIPPKWVLYLPLCHVRRSFLKSMSLLEIKENIINATYRCFGCLFIVYVVFSGDMHMFSKSWNMELFNHGFVRTTAPKKESPNRRGFFYFSRDFIHVKSSPMLQQGGLW